MNDKLKDLVSDLESSYGKGIMQRIGDGNVANVETIPSGNYELDNALGGGYGKGRIVELMGIESSGKAQPLSSNILTPKGWIKMGDVEIGEDVLTPNGDVSSVIGIYPQGEQDVYEITLSDNSKCRCTLDHLWSIRYEFLGEIITTIQTTKSIIDIDFRKKDIYLPDINLKDISKKGNSRKILNIELVGREECQCIMIDHESHLYVTDDYIPTHNTTYTLMAIAEAQKKGGLCAFVDTEHALDINYAKSLGVDIDNLYLVQPDYAEQALEILDRIVSSGEFDIAVLDSVAALTCKKELEGEVGDQVIGVVARLMSQSLRKLVGKAHKSGTTVFYISQIRDKIGVMFGPTSTTTGGNALKFYASQRLDVFRPSTQIKKGDDVIGGYSRVKVIKNKIAPPFKSIELPVIFGKGIDNMYSLLNVCVDKGIVKKGGSWYSYGDMKLGQGADNVILLLKDNPELVEELEEKIKNGKLDTQESAD